MRSLAMLIYDSSLIGGAERISLMLANDLKDYQVTVISVFQDKGKPIIPLHGDVRHYVLSPKPLKIPFHLGSLSRKMAAILKKEEVDLVLSVTAGMNGLTALACLRRRIPWLYWEHSNLKNNAYGLKHRLRQWIGVFLAQHVVTLTEPDREFFCSTCHLPANRVTAIPNYFAFKPVTHSYRVDSKRIVSVGRLNAIKQFDHVIKVARKVFDRHPDWSWDIYGEGEERPHLEGLITQLALTDHVFLRGAHPNPVDVLSEYSFLVVTSRYEGGPLVVQEAQSQHLPTISYDCPIGPRTLITDGVNGLLVKDQDQVDLEDKINLLIEDKELRQRFSSQADKDLARYSKEAVIAQWKKLIGQLLDGEGKKDEGRS